MKRLLLILTLFFVFAFTANAQQQAEDKVCISQEAANLAAVAVRERDALRNEVTVLKTARENDRTDVTDLKIRLAAETQKNIDKEAELVRMTAIVEFLLKNGRVKKYGIINF